MSKLLNGLIKDFFNETKYRDSWPDFFWLSGTDMEGHKDVEYLPYGARALKRYLPARYEPISRALIKHVLARFEAIMKSKLSPDDKIVELETLHQQITKEWDLLKGSKSGSKSGLESGISTVQ